MAEFRSQPEKLEQHPRLELNLANFLTVFAAIVLSGLGGGGIGYLAFDLWMEGRELTPPAPPPSVVLVVTAEPAIVPPILDPTAEPGGEDGYSELPGIGHPAPAPIPTIEPDPWGALDLGSGVETYLTFNLDRGLGSYQVGFYPFAWYPGIFETPAFDPDYSGAVAWTDDLGRTLLWVHSGPNHTMTPLQRFIERDERGNTVLWQEAERRLAENVRNATVQINQPGTYEGWAWVVAWARIRPDQVDESLGAVMDLPGYLDQLQPGRGWDVVMANPDAVVLYFCGRQLAGEDKDPGRPYWQQTRYVLGMVPVPMPEDWPGAGDVMARRSDG